jgi:drug/metabolite transporter (DMT)-like permease
MTAPHSAEHQSIKPHIRGIALVTLGVLVLTPDGLLTTLVSADKWTMLFWRGLLMALALIVFSLARRRHAPITVKAVGSVPTLAVAALFACSSIAFVTAIVTTSVANTLFLIAAAPLFAAAFAWLFLKEPVALRTIVAIVIVLAGMAVIFGDGLGRGDALGNVSAVFAAACWAAMLVVLRQAPQTNIGFAMAVGGCLIAAVALFIAPTLAVSAADAVWLGLLGLLVLPISFNLIGQGPRYMPAAEVSLIVLLEAVIGPLWAWAFVGQVPALTSLAGGVVIIATLAIYFFVNLRREGAVAGLKRNASS